MDLLLTMRLIEYSAAKYKLNDCSARQDPVHRCIVTVILVPPSTLIRAYGSFKGSNQGVREKEWKQTLDLVPKNN